VGTLTPISFAMFLNEVLVSLCSNLRIATSVLSNCKRIQKPYPSFQLFPKKEGVAREEKTFKWLSPYSTAKRL